MLKCFVNVAVALAFISLPAMVGACKSTNASSDVKFFSNKEKAPLQTVESVDVARYLGKWYEIARLPQIFQPGCTAVTAEYSLNEDGSVKVFNFCRILDPVKGKEISITGRAVPTDSSNSKLDVTFFNGIAKGKYWILELDADYEYALVGDPARASLYLLSRKPMLDEAVKQRLLDLAVTKHGYDISRLVMTKQLPE